METKITSIIKEIRTKEDLMSLRAGLEELEMNHGGTGEKSWEKILENALPERFSIFLGKLFGELSPEERLAGLKNMLPELKNSVSKMRILKLDLAFEPTGEVVENLNHWVDEELGYDVVLDISYEKSLLGGARLVFGGKYADYSAAKYLEEMLAKEKEKILRDLPH